MSTAGETRRIYAGAVLYGLVAMVLVLLVASLYYLVRNAQAGSETRRLLIECTVPPEERVPPLKHAGPTDCYLRSQARTGAVVGQIGDISVIAAACGAAHPGDIPATRDCVEEGLSR